MCAVCDVHGSAVSHSPLGRLRGEQQVAARVGQSEEGVTEGDQAFDLGHHSIVCREPDNRSIRFAGLPPVGGTGLEPVTSCL
jgi:hypothetical protein